MNLMLLNLTTFIVMPTFKTVDTGIEDTNENKMIKSMAMIQDITEFDDIDLIN